jgi:hypothetical protein
MEMPLGGLMGTHLIFRPDSFFLRPWTGGGVSRSATGRITGRFTAQGQGTLNEADRSAMVEQTFRYDDARVANLVWKVVSDDDGHFVATEQTSGIQAEGGMDGQDFRWSFQAPSPTPFGIIRVTCEVTYTMVEADAALSFAKLTRWGIPFGSLTTYYRHR